MQVFIKELGKYRGYLPRQIIKTLRGQALSGDLVGAKKGLEKIKLRLERGDSRYENCSS
ncbi:hypothetical protein [Clostridium celatum]|uniref:Uncharacterized protein n=1 Tax=Clostridium celatum DSM 1785 TaxID=545697 RepID=L1QJA8_9CLOT|nr:hypothetical protein [Clostridium celatum]EKY28099.1 hypothetical protein HMPREF0216_00941 [Clostridium celatum DSM 1785]MCE9654138.1 hypothetical protein [Clostridium celatum]